jgi:predicted DNA-binding transcriptional regulator AlpA
MRAGAVRDRLLLRDEQPSETYSSIHNAGESSPSRQYHQISGKILPQIVNPRHNLPNEYVSQQRPGQERLLNAREVASKLGVSERWVRDHTTRRSPKIRAVKLGTLVRYRWADVEVFMEGLDTLRPSRQAPFGV